MDYQLLGGLASLYLLERGDMNKAYLPLIAVGVLLLASVICVIGTYSWLNGLRNEGLDHETPLTSAYQGCQSNYSSYAAGFQEQFGTLTFSKEAMESILKVMGDTVAGRYDELDANGNPTGVINSQLFLEAMAVVEAYPDAGIPEFMARIGDLQTWIQSKRESFHNCQLGLLDRLSAYDNWRSKGLIRSWAIREVLQFPTDRLRAQIGTTVYYREDAYDKMRQLVLAQGAIDAYNSGVDIPLIPPTPNP